MPPGTCGGYRREECITVLKVPSKIVAIGQLTGGDGGRGGGADYGGTAGVREGRAATLTSMNDRDKPVTYRSQTFS